jgi:hypothetical protein
VSYVRHLTTENEKEKELTKKNGNVEVIIKEK